jgi:hypothetical protein
MSKNKTKNKDIPADAKSTAPAPAETKIVVEVRIPQLENQGAVFTSNQKAADSSRLQLDRTHLAQANAVVKITPVKRIHVVEVDVNAKTILKDLDIEADQPFEKSGEVSPTKPISFFISITGEANTKIDVELHFNGHEEFNGSLFIPKSGRLADQKILI